ncbi:MAG TPA: inositol monophosphatase family protein [Acidimicrobiales bacterium]|nr:inositol monophosphatase family protein [Acidimicrobiales bacterium]
MPDLRDASEPTPSEPLAGVAGLAGLAVEAAHAAGALLLDGASRLRTVVETKTTATDMVTEMDRASEALIAELILGARPGDAFLGEEGTAGSGTTGVRWVVDPLDGTTNYLYGFPSWAVSIAAEIDGEPAIGVVFDPTHADTYRAVRGEGAWCNGERLKVLGASDLATSLVATGFGYDAAVRAQQAQIVARLLPSVRDMRRAGAASVDLCWLARGRVDIYYERGLQHWDYAAGALIAGEAGAEVQTLEDGTMVATSPRLIGPFLELLHAAGIPGGNP